jgi:parallel beta-helix repeat protein
VTFVSAVPAPYEGNDTWIFPSLDVSATKRINISVTVNPSIPMGTYLHNIVKVTCDEGVTDSDTEDTIVSSEHNCTCGDICVNTTGWWRDGGAFYPSDTPIQDAIDNASAGDTICVKDGEYNENVDVDKRLAIKSENGAASTTVNALDSNDHVFGVTADYVTISGFMVKGADSPRARIFLVGVAHCNISDNIANSINGAGIRLRQSSNNILAGNTANSNNDDGILLWLEGSNSNTLIGNTANNGYYGLFLLSSCSNTFIGNTVNSNSGDGIRVELNSDSNTFIGNTASSNRENGIYLTKSSNDNTLSGNTANWNYECGIRLYSSCNTLSDNIASNNCDGIVLQGSSNNTLAGNTANSNNGCGILLDHWGYVLFSSNNTLAGNTANSNFHGISLGSSHSNTLSSNTANSNNECGILLRGGWFNTLKNNTASNNSDGIFLYARYNTLTGNTVSNNDAGIHLEGRSRNNTITSNTASSNNYGVYLISSGNGGNNLIYNNYFNNTNNAWDDGNNIWNITKTAGPNIIGGSWLGGNYWSDYDGIDGNGDGLGDTLLPYNSLGNILQGGDWHPLVEVSLPDLVITEKWLCWPDNCTICYNVTNIGDGTAPACHNTALYVDGVVVAHDHVPEDLASGESYTGCFNGYVWGYTPPSDEIKVCADYNEAIDELDEDNNCLPDIWMCGDVNCDGKVTMSDVRKVFNRYLDPNYPLDLPWAADVNCDGKVTMSDVRKVFNRYLDPSYGLNCCCRV